MFIVPNFSTEPYLKNMGIINRTKTLSFNKYTFFSSFEHSFSAHVAHKRTEQTKQRTHTYTFLICQSSPSTHTHTQTSTPAKVVWVLSGQQMSGWRARWRSGRTWALNFRNKWASYQDSNTCCLFISPLSTHPLTTRGSQSALHFSPSIYTFIFYYWRYEAFFYLWWLLLSLSVL